MKGWSSGTILGAALRRSSKSSVSGGKKQRASSLLLSLRGKLGQRPPPKPHGMVSCDDVSAIVKEISSHSAPDDGSGRGGDEIERRGSSFGVKVGAADSSLLPVRQLSLKDILKAEVEKQEMRRAAVPDVISLMPLPAGLPPNASRAAAVRAAGVRPTPKPGGAAGKAPIHQPPPPYGVPGSSSDSSAPPRRSLLPTGLPPASEEASNLQELPEDTNAVTKLPSEAIELLPDSPATSAPSSSGMPPAGLERKNTLESLAGLRRVSTRIANIQPAEPVDVTASVTMPQKASRARPSLSCEAPVDLGAESSETAIAVGGEASATAVERPQSRRRSSPNSSPRRSRRPTVSSPRHRLLFSDPEGMPLPSASPGARNLQRQGSSSRSLQECSVRSEDSIDSCNRMMADESPMLKRMQLARARTRGRLPAGCIPAASPQQVSERLERARSFREDSAQSSENNEELSGSIMSERIDEELSF